MVEIACQLTQPGEGGCALGGPAGMLLDAGSIARECQAEHEFAPRRARPACRGAIERGEKLVVGGHLNAGVYRRHAASVPPRIRRDESKP